MTAIARAALLGIVLGMTSASTHAQVVLDAGFEGYAVAPGGFVKPTTGVWTFTNDAGVVEPFSPNSSTGVLNTWSATRAAYQGQQYASTYAGGDSIRQPITFDTAGVYALSVRAFAPDGMVTFGTDTVPVSDGQFRFVLDVPVGPTFTVPAGSDWTLYSTQVTVAAPGVYNVGVNNSLIATYFVNYDDFRITVVPEPAAAGMMLTMLLMSSWRMPIAAQRHRRPPRSSRLHRARV
jgi:hypothetical protein